MNTTQRDHWRMMRRQMAETVINVAGLAVAIAMVILVGVFLEHEWTYDRFHEKADRVYAVYRETGSADGEDKHSAMLREPVMDVIAEGIPGVSAFVRAYSGYIHVSSERVADGASTLAVDPAFLDVFSFPLVSGDPEKALGRPDAVVLTSALAEKHFGDQDPMGQVIALSAESYPGQKQQTGPAKVDRVVTGVLAAILERSSIRFHMLVPLQTREDLAFRGLWGVFVELEDTKYADRFKQQLTEVAGELPGGGRIGLRALPGHGERPDLAGGTDESGRRVAVRVKFALRYE